MNKESTNNNKKEVKEFVDISFECKELESDEEFFYFKGYLSTYGNVDRVNDYFVKGAFDQSIKELWPKLLWQHEDKEIIGVFEDILSDDKGLFVKGKMPKTDTLVSGRVIPQMKVGSIRSMSVGFFAEEWEIDEKGCRKITKAFLVEGSLVSIPANPEAQITSFKSFEYEQVKEVKTKRQVEKLLRESGAFSKKSAIYLASMIEEPKRDEKSLRDSVDYKSQLANELLNFTNVARGN